jgi:uncharacterized protein YjiS (DUF1127 family)
VVLQRNTKFVAAQQKRRTGVYVMSFLNLFISAGKALSAWRRRERAYAELMTLDDRTLADIGIRRSQIRALVEGDDPRGRQTEPAPSQQEAAFRRRKAA